MVNTGGSSDLLNGTWDATSLSNAPSARWLHAAVWTGAEMIVWGGRADLEVLNHAPQGGRYDLEANTWNKNRHDFYLRYQRKRERLATEIRRNTEALVEKTTGKAVKLTDPKPRFTEYAAPKK